MVEPKDWHPTWSVSPGEILTEALDERGMSQAELSRRMARPLKTISEIATGKAAITPETAIQLERTLGISAALWLGLESRYREAQARLRDESELERHVAWLGNFPSKALKGLGILTRTLPPTQQAAQLLAFFGVSSPAGWDQHWGQVAATYRMAKNGSVSPYSVALWLRLAEREADGIDLPRYAPMDIPRLVGSLRPLSREIVIDGALESAADLLGSAGVGLLLVKGVPGAPASGAVYWIRENPWIILTGRYMTDDQLWFSLFHEIGHLTKARPGKDVIEDLDGPIDELSSEALADSFARENLVPEDEIQNWLRRNVPTRESIIDFAEHLRVSPGVVVGRLERDGLVDRGRFDRLRKRWRSAAA